jgi:hypothetical protein
MPVIICFLLLSNIIYANQAYLWKDLAWQNTMSTVNRIIDRMEQTDGYCVGETPVAFVGGLYASELWHERDGFEISGTGLSDFNFVFTYYDTYKWYFDYVLAYPINFIEEEELEEWSVNEEVIEMPPFPENGSVKIINGTMVVKLSD